ncbi:MAG: alkaline phosphatase [Actinobacteria bacterium]|nr:alkaline phosphatase [Actinomycetota bacterium]
MRRRQAVALGAALAVTAGGIAAATSIGSYDQPQYGERTSQSKAKNIILLIGDGMGVSHVAAARTRYYGSGGRLWLERTPVLGSVTTYEVERKKSVGEPDIIAPVPDSASAGTSWSSGVKTYNAAVGKNAAGQTVATIMEQAKQRGMRTGNVSTAEITDATPAVMFSHVNQRSCQGPVFTTASCEPGDVPIAEQIASNNVADVILGGGLSRFRPDEETLMKKNGYTVLGSFGAPAVATQTTATQKVATKAELAAVAGSDRRLIGLFNRGNLTVEKFKSDNPTSVEAKGEPTLQAMTDKAIELLANSRQGRDRGFFLQVEGALIDKRSHANDAAQTLGEMKAFDDAVRSALEFAKRDGNTLVIVTADHECAGFNIIEKGSFANAEAKAGPPNVDSGNLSNSSVPARTSASNVKDPIRSTGPVNAGGASGRDPQNFAPATFRTATDPPSVKDGSPDASLWLTYVSGNHTGADVNLYASGPGSKQFDDKIDNTGIYFRMRAALRAFSGS